MSSTIKQISRVSGTVDTTPPGKIEVVEAELGKVRNEQGTMQDTLVLMLKKLEPGARLQFLVVNDPRITWNTKDAPIKEHPIPVKDLGDVQQASFDGELLNKLEIHAGDAFELRQVDRAGNVSEPTPVELSGEGELKSFPLHGFDASIGNTTVQSARMVRNADQTPPVIHADDISLELLNADGKAVLRGELAVERYATVTLKNLRTRQEFSVRAGANGSFNIPVDLNVGDYARIWVKDRNNVMADLGTLEFTPVAAAVDHSGSTTQSSTTPPGKAGFSPMSLRMSTLANSGNPQVKESSSGAPSPTDTQLRVPLNLGTQSRDELMSMLEQTDRSGPSHDGARVLSALLQRFARSLPKHVRCSLHEGEYRVAVPVPARAGGGVNVQTFRSAQEVLDRFGLGKVPQSQTQQPTQVAAPWMVMDNGRLNLAATLLSLAQQNALDEAKVGAVMAHLGSHVTAQDAETLIRWSMLPADQPVESAHLSSIQLVASHAQQHVDKLTTSQLKDLVQMADSMRQKLDIGVDLLQLILRRAGRNIGVEGVNRRYLVAIPTTDANGGVRNEWKDFGSINEALRFMGLERWHETSQQPTTGGTPAQGTQTGTTPWVPDSTHVTPRPVDDGLQVGGMLDTRLSLKDKLPAWGHTDYFPLVSSRGGEDPAHPLGDPLRNEWAHPDVGGVYGLVDKVRAAMNLTTGAWDRAVQPYFGYTMGRPSGLMILDAQVTPQNFEAATGMDINQDGRFSTNMDAGQVLSRLRVNPFGGERSINTGWFGNCNGVSAAQCVAKKPQHAVSIKRLMEKLGTLPPGGRAPAGEFRPEQIEMLLARAAESTAQRITYSGYRFNGEKDRVKLADGRVLEGTIQGLDTREFRSGQFAYDGDRVVRTGVDRPIRLTTTNGTVHELTPQQVVQVSRELQEDSPEDHLRFLLENLKKGNPVTVDRSPGTQVWNTFVNGAKVTESTTPPAGMDPQHGLDGHNGRYDPASGHKLTYVDCQLLQDDGVVATIRCWREWDGNKVVNSGWTEETSIDFMWAMEFGPNGPDWSGSLPDNPMVPKEWVRVLGELSQTPER